MLPWDLLRYNDVVGHKPLPEVTYRVCGACDQAILFYGETLIYPKAASGPTPNHDLPADALKSFNEARLVATDSPRAAAALLRLAIEQLTVHVAPHLEGKRLNDRIGELLKAGLEPDVADMLDSVRVVGNGGAHAGELDPDVDPSLVDSLFELVNEICDELVSAPKRRKAILDRMTPEQRAGIERRNTKALTHRSSSDAA